MNDRHEPEGSIDELLDDLEIRCATGVGAARHVSSSRRRMAIAIRPGNVHERGSANPAIAGESTEFRRQGLTLRTARPLMVGDIFHLTFDAPDYDVAPVLAMCERCSMLGTDSFEVRFLLVREPDLPEPQPFAPAGTDDELDS